MTALEYYERDKLIPFPESGEKNMPAVREWAKKLVDEFLDERINGSIPAKDVELLILSQNQKWNALCDIFETKHGVSPLSKDALKIIWFGDERINDGRA